MATMKKLAIQLVADTKGFQASMKSSADAAEALSKTNKDAQRATAAADKANREAATGAKSAATAIESLARGNRDVAVAAADATKAVAAAAKADTDAARAAKAAAEATAAAATAAKSGRGSFADFAAGLQLTAKGADAAGKGLAGAADRAGKTAAAASAASTAVKSLGADLAGAGKASEKFAHHLISVTKEGTKASAALTAVGKASKAAAAGKSNATAAAGGLYRALAALGIAVLATAAIRGVASATDEAANSLRNARNAVGGSAESLSGLRSAAATAGVEFPALVGGMQSLGRTVAAAIKEPSGEAATALADLGLSAAQLGAMSPEERLRATADALAGIAPSAEKAAAAEKILGSNAAAILPLLDQGSAALDQGAADAARFGTSLSAVDVAGIAAAQTSLNQLWQVVQGTAITIGTEFAPLVAAAANAIVEFATQNNVAGTAATWLKGVVIEGARWIGKAWDDIYRGSTVVGNGFRSMGIVAVDAMQLLHKPLEWLLWAIDKMRGTSLAGSFKATFAGVRASLEEARVAAHNAQAALDAKPGTGDGWAAALNSVVEAAKAAATNAAKAAEQQRNLASAVDKTAEAAAKLKQSKIDEALAGIAQKLDEFDATNADKAANALKKLGASQEEQDKAAKMTRQLDFLEAGKKATEELMTPTEKYAERLAELDALLAEGAVSQETYARGALKAQQDLASANKSDPSKVAGIVRSGSAEAAKAIAEFRNQGKEDKLPDLAKQQLQKQTESVSLLQRIADGKGGGGAPVTFEVVGL